MKSNHLIWQKLEDSPVYQCRVFSVHTVQSKSPDMCIKHFSIINAPDWAIVIPVLTTSEGKKLVMVRQWRHGEQDLGLEFPGGVIEAEEDELAGAERELEEETGWKAGSIRKLGQFNPNPAIMSNHVHVYLAEDLIKLEKQKLDEDEYVDVELVSLQEVMEGMGRPPYVHALMASALVLYLRLDGNGA